MLFLSDFLKWLFNEKYVWLRLIKQHFIEAEGVCKNLQVETHLFIFQDISNSAVDSPQEDQKMKKAKERKAEQNVWETYYFIFPFDFV